MGKKKTTTTSTYDYKSRPMTASEEKLSKMEAKVDPSIGYTYAKMRQSNANSYMNPLGSATNPATAEAASRVTNNALAQDESQAIQQSQFNADNANFNRTATVAGMTAPQLVQTGGTQTQSGGFWSGLLTSMIGAGSNIGAAALT